MVFLILFGNGIIKMPEFKTEAPVSKIDEILKELESMPVSKIQELKIKIEKILKKQNIIMPIIP